jgi:hypothetical protein
MEMPNCRELASRRQPIEASQPETPEETVMSEAVIGPMEERYRHSQAFRNGSDQTKLTPTHHHIAIANGLGWGFDGMEGAIFALR